MPQVAAHVRIALPFMLAAGVAMAQSASVEGLRDIDDAPIPSLNMSANEIEDMELYGAGGEQIGEVEDVLVDSSGEVAALVVETEEFLGIGDDDVVVAIDQVQVVEGRLVTSLTEEQLEQLPEWDD